MVLMLWPHTHTESLEKAVRHFLYFILVFFLVFNLDQQNNICPQNWVTSPEHDIILHSKLYNSAFYKIL
jgi:hypothetical protein